MVGGWMFLLVSAHPGSPRRAIKRLLLYNYDNNDTRVYNAVHCLGTLNWDAMLLSIDQCFLWICITHYELYLLWFLTKLGLKELHWNSCLCEPSLRNCVEAWVKELHVWCSIKELEQRVSEISTHCQGLEQDVTELQQTNQVSFVLQKIFCSCHLLL